MSLTCYSNGMVALSLLQSPFAPFRDLLDLFHEGVSADFSQDGFKMYTEGSSEEYQYGEYVAYKQQPLLLKWLQQQEMTMPEFPKEKT